MTSTPETIKFARLQIEGWRQFANIDIELHPQLTVITGANGSGKSTLLNIFSSHFGYHRPYLATPQWDSSGAYRYLNGLTALFRKVFSRPSHGPDSVGEIAYTNRKTVSLTVPSAGGIQYQLTLQPQESVPGFHVPSHRRLPNYQTVQHIPTEPMLPAQAYSHFSNEMAAAFQGGHTGFSPIYRIKESLLSMAVLGPKTAHNRGNEMLVRTFTGFSETLRKILPEEIGFLDISIRSPDVVLVTKSGDFLIDAASGGLMALVDLAWQIYMFSLTAESFVVTIDEPENHLHPSMQRTLMGNLLNTFPKVQFIVATHSPFIVSAVRDARVYALRHEEREQPESETTESRQTRFVTSVRLESVSRAGTASQILRDILGLPTTYPEWVTDGIEATIQKYRNQPFNNELLSAIRADLKNAGYSELYPEVTAALLKK